MNPKAIASLLLLSSATLTMSLLRSPVGMYAGLAMVGGAYGINRKHQLANGDYVAVLSESANGFAEGWQHLFETFAFSRKDIGEARKLIEVKNLQKELKTTVQAWVEAESIKGEWLADCIRRSLLVCGVSGDGKTTFLLWVLAQHFERQVDLHVTICDLDYGSSHEGSEPNWWFHLPRERYIRANYEEIRDSILTESAEVDRRAQTSQDPQSARNFQSRLLVIDELIAVIDMARSKGKEEFEAFTSAFKNILNRGLKQRVKIVCGVQNLTVTDTGLSLAAQDSFNTIVLHTSALKKDPLRRMGVEDVDVMLERAKAITKIPGCDRIGVVRTNQEINIRVMPYLSVDSVALKLPTDNSDPLEIWAQQIFTEAKLAEIQALAEQFLAKEIKSPLRQLAIDCGLKELRNADPKYQRVKQVWENALNKTGVLA